MKGTYIVIAASIALTALLLLRIHLYLRKMKASIGVWKYAWDNLILEPVVFIFRWMPGGWGFFGRNILYKLLFKRLGKETAIAEGVKIQYPENISMGSYCHVNHNCFIDGHGGIQIGNWVRIGAGTNIMTVMHNYEETDKPIKRQGLTMKKTVIEDDVVTGVNAIILPGITVGKGSYISAGSVVAADVPAGAMVAGNPARIFKKRE
jgi:acetyltransferase-like isoleucine patch superfamily enzyme